MKINELITSIFCLIVVFILISIPHTNYILKPRLYDGTINELGRYSFTFDAYQHIESESENSVIALGSSKMREIFNGAAIQNHSNTDTEFFNLGYAGERYYVRMIEIDAIVALRPNLVVLEVGPNSFSKLSDPVPQNVAAQMIQLMALNPYWLTQSWSEEITELDQTILPMTRVEQLSFYTDISNQAVEASIRYTIGESDQPYTCDALIGNVRCVPMPQTKEYHEYLKYPPQFQNLLEKIKLGQHKWSIEEFYGERLDKYVNSSYHNPEGQMNKNQRALEFMIESFLASGIEVMLVGLPYNPVLLDRLHEGQWDYYNSTLVEYSSKYNITIVDYLWLDSWVEEDFNDYTHAAKSGEEKFAELISPEILKIIG